MTWRPYLLSICGICLGSKIWVGEPGRMRIRVCATCDQIHS